MRFVNYFASNLVLIAVLSLTSTMTTQSFAAAPPGDEPAVSVPQEHGDLQTDPSARFGRLPNGMTYIIYKNATPPGTLSVNLRIAAGSLMERDDEQGLAHFVEHMAFKGSRHIKEGDLLPMLQRNGVKLGLDAEAFTLPNKTEYILDLPKSDTDSTDTALFVIKEIASNLSFAPDAVERERSVILAEERTRDTPVVDAQTAWFEAAFPNQRFGSRSKPIGLPRIIRTLSPIALRKFYDAFYRPELASLVVVGDIDADQMEAKIIAQFGDWKARGPSRSIDFGSYKERGITTFVKAAPSLPNSVKVTWFLPYGSAAETRQKVDENRLDGILIATLNARLQHHSQQQDSAFVSAIVSQQYFYKTGKILQLTIDPKPGQDKLAFVQALSDFHQFVDRGTTLAEVAPVIARQDAALVKSVADAKTRNNREISRTIALSLDNNSAFTSPSQDLADYRRFANSLNLNQIGVRIKVLAAAGGPLLSHTGEELAGLDELTMASTYRSVMAAQTSIYVAESIKAWPYTNFGPNQGPVSHKSYDTFGHTEYTYANGVRLNVLSTTLKDNQVLINVAFKGGQKAIPRDTKAPIAFASFYAGMGGYSGGGVGKLNTEELQKALAGKSVGITYVLGADTAILSGMTTKSDFSTECQLIMAYINDAAYRSALFDQLHATLPTVYAQLSGSPQAVLQTHIDAITHVHDNRYNFPTLDQAQELTFDQIKSVIKSSLENRPVEITVVGDIDAESVVKTIGNTFGNLTNLPALPVPVLGAKGQFPASALDVTLYHKGRSDQSMSLVAWPVPDAPSDAGRSRALQILTEIINERAFRTIRERLGQAYDANANLVQSFEYEGFGYLQVSGAVAAGHDAEFRQTVGSIVDDLKTHAISQDELEQARKPIIARAANSRKQNAFWMRAISTAGGDQRRSAYYMNEISDLNAVTPDVIQKLARTYLINDKALHVKVMPDPTSLSK